MNELVKKIMEKNRKAIDENFRIIMEDKLPTAELIKLGFESIRSLIDYSEKLALEGESAIETLEYIKYIINDCYNKKNEITPNCNSKNLISAVDIYEYLPKINCGKCGVTTCLAFADKLMKGQFNPNRCVHLYEVSNKDNKEEVENMVLALGYYL